VHPDDLREQGPTFRLAVGKQGVGQVLPAAREVGRQHRDPQVEDLPQLVRGRQGGGGHPREVRVPSAEALQGERPEDPADALGGHPLLGLHRGLQPVGPVAQVHDPAGELVDDLDPPVPDEVVDPGAQQDLRVQGAAHRGQQRVVGRVVQSALAERVLDAPDPLLREEDAAVFRVGVVVPAPLQGPHQGREPRPVVDHPRVGAGDHQGHSGLVEQERVGLVEQDGVQGTVDPVRDPLHQAVAQKIETRLLGRGVGHVARVRRPLGVRVLPLLDAADGQPEQAVHRPHPGRVPPGEEIVEGQHVHALPGEGLEGRGQDRGQGLALARGQLDDEPLAEGQPRGELAVVQLEPEGPTRRRQHQRTQLWRQRGQGGAGPGRRAQGRGPGRQRRVGGRGQIHGPDGLNRRQPGIQPDGDPLAPAPAEEPRPPGGVCRRGFGHGLLEVGDAQDMATVCAGIKGRPERGLSDADTPATVRPATEPGRT